MAEAGTRDETVAGLLRHAERLLEDSPTPRLDAEILLTSLLDRDRAWCYAHPEDCVPKTVSADFHMLIEQRRDGCPVAYLTGQREFWSLPLLVDRRTLIPRPETECLVEFALEAIAAPGTDRHVLDLGTGTGAIALALARERPDATITAADISTEALGVARANAARLGLRIAEFVSSDWLAQMGNRRFDVIVSNPPYVESGHEGFASGETRFEPRLARDGGPDGLYAIRRIVPSTVRYLNSGACVCIEHGAAQGPAVRAIFSAAGFHRIETRRDAAGHERVTRGSWS